MQSMDRGDQAYESSELLLYRNTILEDGGELNEALADLTKIDEKVLDKYSLKERRGETSFYPTDIKKLIIVSCERRVEADGRSSLVQPTVAIR